MRIKFKFSRIKSFSLKGMFFPYVDGDEETAAAEKEDGSGVVEMVVGEVEVPMLLCRRWIQDRIGVDNHLEVN